MRDQIAKALGTAAGGCDKRRACMLRLIGTAIRDRDVANRMAGRDRLSDVEITALLATMIRQRETSAALLDAAGEADGATAERAEIAVLSEFLPAPLPASEVEAACRKAVADTGSKGLRDVGRCMSALKERYHDKMNLVEASTVVRGLLR